MTRKRRVWKKLKRCKNDKKRLKFKSISTALKRSIGKHFYYKEKRIINSGDKKSFYKYVKRSIRNNTDIPPLKGEGGNFIVSDTDKATAFNNYFCTVFTKDNGCIISKNTCIKPNLSMANIQISDSDICKAILRLNNDSSPGHDGLPTTVFKKLMSSLVNPLKLIFNASLNLGNIPDIWKVAAVVPIYKKGDKALVSNYRPVSLTAITCKIMERIIVQSLKAFMLTNNLISSNQYAYLAGRSCQAQLISFVNKLIADKCAKSQIDTVYIDFSKAFDSVVHKKLMFKLKCIGFSNQLLTWTESFLNNRFQYVRIGKSVSDMSHVKSGVPQGSVLGPFLFLIYINDILEFSNVTPFAFADDLKSCSRIRNTDDCKNFQKYLNRINTWSKDWQMALAPNKRAVSYSRACPLNFQYKLDDILIPRVIIITDLGIEFQSNLCFTAHINKICRKALILSLMIFKHFCSKDPLLLFKAFKIYVRPVLESCSCLWNPYKLKDIRKVELIQRKFTKRLRGLENLSYNERLKRLKADTLELRRVKADLYLYYKIIHNVVDVSEDLKFTFKSARSLRGHSFTICKPVIKSNAEKYSFNNRSIDVWNKLPQHIVNASNFKNFKLTVNKLPAKFFFNKFVFINKV